MPLGSSKFARNKNKFAAGTGTGLIPVINITDTISNVNVSTIDYRTVTYDITSNRPNTRFSYEMAGNVSQNDFTDAKSYDDFTTDINGNAQIIKSVTAAGSDNLDFKLNVVNGIFPGNEVFANSNINIIYAVQYPDISGGNVVVIDTGNIYLDGKYHTLTVDNATININTTGTLKTNAFKTITGYYDATSYYYNNVFRILAISGGGGSANIADVAAGGGGAGTVLLTSANVENLANIVYTTTVGAGGLSTSDVVAQPAGNPGSNTIVFAGTSIEINVGPGGEGGKTGSNPDGGNSSLFVGGNGVVSANLNYATGGGGAGAGNVGGHGAIVGSITPRGGGVTYADANGYDGMGQTIYRHENPMFNGINPNALNRYAGGGGGSGINLTGNPAYYGRGANSSYYDSVLTEGGGNGVGLPGVNPGPSNPTSGVNGTGGGCGGGADKGGDGIIVMRYPAGTDFRFISNVNLA
tara:strand:+ start:8239 stop:9639 length:1401 start_codon:yes stop_codon:yes gene_type:complete